MEDRGTERIVKKTIIIIIAVLIIGVVIFAGSKLYKNYLTNKNTSLFTDVLTKQEFSKNNDGTYTKTIKNNNKMTEYIYTETTSSFLKNIEIINNNSSKFITLNYKSNYIVEGTLQYHGFNKNNQYGNLLLSSSYNIKNNKFKCNILTNDGFDIICNQLKNESIEMTKEIKSWAKNTNFEFKYIK